MSRKELLEVGPATGFVDLASGGLGGGFRTVAPTLCEATSRMELGRRRGWTSGAVADGARRWVGYVESGKVGSGDCVEETLVLGLQRTKCRDLG